MAGFLWECSSTVECRSPTPPLASSGAIPSTTVLKISFWECSSTVECRSPKPKMRVRHLPLLFMFYVYLLELNRPKDKYYIGYSSDLKRRIVEHQSGMVESTRYYKPIKLIYYESFEKEQLARKREESLKSSGSAYMGLMKRLGLK